MIPSSKEEGCQSIKYGDIPGIKIGTVWQDRSLCSRAGVHLPVRDLAHTGSSGIYSLLLDGEWCLDFGEKIFCKVPKGGIDLIGNDILSLIKNHETGNPIRIVRGTCLKSSYASNSGFRYDGLYIVKKAVKKIFKSGDYEHEFVLVRRENQPCAPWKEEYSDKLMMPTSSKELENLPSTEEKSGTSDSTISDGVHSRSKKINPTFKKAVSFKDKASKNIKECSFKEYIVLSQKKHETLNSPSSDVEGNEKNLKKESSNVVNKYIVSLQKNRKSLNSPHTEMKSSKVVTLEEREKNLEKKTISGVAKGDYHTVSSLKKGLVNSPFTEVKTFEGSEEKLEKRANDVTNKASIEISPNKVIMGKHEKKLESRTDDVNEKMICQETNSNHSAKSKLVKSDIEKECSALQRSAVATVNDLFCKNRSTLLKGNPENLCAQSMFTPFMSENSQCKNQSSANSPSSRAFCDSVTGLCKYFQSKSMVGNKSLKSKGRKSYIVQKQHKLKKIMKKRNKTIDNFDQTRISHGVNISVAGEDEHKYFVRSNKHPSIITNEASGSEKKEIEFSRKGKRPMGNISESGISPSENRLVQGINSGRSNINLNSSVNLCRRTSEKEGRKTELAQKQNMDTEHEKIIGKGEENRECVFSSPSVDRSAQDTISEECVLPNASVISNVDQKQSQFTDKNYCETDLSHEVSKKEIECNRVRRKRRKMMAQISDSEMSSTKYRSVQGIILSRDNSENGKQRKLLQNQHMETERNKITEEINISSSSVGSLLQNRNKEECIVDFKSSVSSSLDNEKESDFSEKHNLQIEHNKEVSNMGDIEDNEVRRIREKMSESEMPPGEDRSVQGIILSRETSEDENRETELFKKQHMEAEDDKVTEHINLHSLVRSAQDTKRGDCSIDLNTSVGSNEETSEGKGKLQYSEKHLGNNPKKVGRKREIEGKKVMRIGKKVTQQISEPPSEDRLEQGVNREESNFDLNASVSSHERTSENSEKNPKGTEHKKVSRKRKIEYNRAKYIKRILMRKNFNSNMCFCEERTVQINSNRENSEDEGRKTECLQQHMETGHIDNARKTAHTKLSRKFEHDKTRNKRRKVIKKMSDSKMHSCEDGSLQTFTLNGETSKDEERKTEILQKQHMETGHDKISRKREKNSKQVINLPSINPSIKKQFIYHSSPFVISGDNRKIQYSEKQHFKIVPEKVNQKKKIGDNKIRRKVTEEKSKSKMSSNENRLVQGVNTEEHSQHKSLILNEVPSLSPVVALERISEDMIKRLCRKKRKIRRKMIDNSDSKISVPKKRLGRKKLSKLKDKHGIRDCRVVLKRLGFPSTMLHAESSSVTVSDRNNESYIEEFSDSDEEWRGWEVVTCNVNVDLDKDIFEG